MLAQRFGLPVYNAMPRSQRRRSRLPHALQRRLPAQSGPRRPDDPEPFSHRLMEPDLLTSAAEPAEALPLASTPSVATSNTRCRSSRAARCPTSATARSRYRSASCTQCGAWGWPRATSRSRTRASAASCSASSSRTATALTFTRLVHLRVARPVLVLRRTGCADDGGIHDLPVPTFSPRAFSASHTVANSVSPSSCFCSRCRNSSSVGCHRAPARAPVDAHEAQRFSVQRYFLAGLIGQVEPVLHEVHAQHALQPNRRSPIASLRIMRLDGGKRLWPRHDPLHHRQKYIAPSQPAILLGSGTLIGCRRKGLLLPAKSPADRHPPAVTPPTLHRWTCSALPRCLKVEPAAGAGAGRPSHSIRCRS